MMSSIIPLIPLLSICCQPTNAEKVAVHDSRRRLPPDVCEDGYELDTDGVTCIDIDECAMYNGGCSGICINTDGSFMCMTSSPTSVPTENPIEPISGPANDDICNAIDIIAAAPIDEKIIGATNIDANDDPTAGTFCGTSISGGGVWYRLLIPNGQHGDVAYQIEVESHSFDTKLSAFTADACDGELTCIAGNDDGAGIPGFGSRLEFQGTFNEVYLLLHGFLGASGTTNLIITSQTAAPTSDPTSYPSADPTVAPTSDPTQVPTMNPTIGCGVNNGGCQQICLDEPGAIPYTFECACNSGYSLQADGVTYVDINECDNGCNGGCAQICTNLPGSYACSCNYGFELDADGKSCDDIDECLDDTLYSCGEYAYCKNEKVKKNGDLGYRCKCNPGFTGDGQNCMPARSNSKAATAPNGKSATAPNGKSATAPHGNNPAMAMHYEEDDHDLNANDDVTNIGTKSILSVWSCCVIATFLYFVF